MENSNITAKKEMHIFMWEKIECENCDNAYKTNEYVFETLPTINEILEIIGDKDIWIAIGKNPSKANGALMDETNIYIKNKLITDKHADGYILLNLYSDIATTFRETLKGISNDYFDSVCNILDALSDKNILLFYGPSVITKLGRFKTIGKKTNLIKFFEKLKSRDNVYHTGNKNYFGHPANMKGSWNIVKNSDYESKDCFL